MSLNCTDLCPNLPDNKDQLVSLDNLMASLDSDTALCMFDDMICNESNSNPTLYSWQKSLPTAATNDPFLFDSPISSASTALPTAVKTSFNTYETFYNHISMLHGLNLDPTQQSSSTTPIEREKISRQLLADIFDRLLKFGSEPDRPLFCQRLQMIWENQGVFCQSYPTITNQILDLYKLHRLVQEKEGYLEITTNRGWKEISNVLGFGDSGSAAYSVKRNYVRLGLLAYECRFDRAGIDPRSVIEQSEMPHAVKKRKRGSNASSSTTRAIAKANKQQLQMLSLQQQPPKNTDDQKLTCIVDDSSQTPPSPTIVTIDSSLISTTTHQQSEQAIPRNTPKPCYRRRCFPQSSSLRLTPQQMPIHDFSRFAYTLRAGRLGDSNKHLDTLLVWLSDPRTASYFDLKCLPGLFNVIIEQYLACLYELFGQSFVRSSPNNDLYINWFLQSKWRFHDSSIGPISNRHRLESLFFGPRRYMLKRLLPKISKPKAARIFEQQQDIELINYHPERQSFDSDETMINHSFTSPLSIDISSHTKNDPFEFDPTLAPPSFSSYFSPNCSPRSMDDYANRSLISRGRGRGRGRPRLYPRETSTRGLFRSRRGLRSSRSTRRPSLIRDRPSPSTIDSDGESSNSNTSHVLRPSLTNDDDEQHSERSHVIMTRCTCLATIIRNLSFVEENQFLANDRRLLDILERILNCQHREMHRQFDYDLEEPYIDACSNCSDGKQYQSGCSAFQNDSDGDFFQTFYKTDLLGSVSKDDPLSCACDCDGRQVMLLLDHTLITLSNLATIIELRHCHSITRHRLVNTLTHWILCSLTFAVEPFISMISENAEKVFDPKEQIFVSPRQLSLQILAKLCTREANVDLIILDLTTKQLKSLGHALLSIMAMGIDVDVDREYSLLIICSLCKRNQQLTYFFGSHTNCIQLLFDYLEQYEYFQQQHFIATLTSCYNASSTMPINHSLDMMLDSCIQLLVLFAPMTRNNRLQAFEFRLLDMSSSIYFEQRLLKAFADILYVLKS